MGFVNHALRPCCARRAIPGPVIGGLNNATLQHQIGIVTAIKAEIGLGVRCVVGIVRVAPAKNAGVGPRIRIDQQLVRIKTQAACRLIRTMHAITIDQPRPCPGQIAMPDLIGAGGQRKARGFLEAYGIEQTQLDAFGVGGKQGEVNTRLIHRRPQRIRTAGA